MKKILFLLRVVTAVFVIAITVFFSYEIVKGMLNGEDLTGIIDRAIVDIDGATQKPAATPVPTPVPTLSIEEKKNSYPVGDYEEYARNPDKYAGQTIQIIGKVMQVVEGDQETDLMIYTDDYANELWFFAYQPADGESRILEDDAVTVYGLYYGIYSYKTVQGDDNSIPAITGENVVLVS